MNDFEYDVYQKKQIARGARYKVNGSRSKKCQLSTDYMTPAQIERQHGEVETCDFGKPISWEDFKNLYPRMGKDYIEHLIGKFNVNYSSLSDMFGVGRKKVSALLSEDPYNIKFGRGCNMTSDDRRRWNEFIGASVIGECDDISEFLSEDSGDVITEHGKNTETEHNENESVSSSHRMKMSSCSIEFSGLLKINEVSNSLKLMFGDNTNGKLKITFESD